MYLKSSRNAYLFIFTISSWVYESLQRHAISSYHLSDIYFLNTPNRGALKTIFNVT